MLLLQPRPFPGYVARGGVFDGDECARIVTLAESRPVSRGLVKHKTDGGGGEAPATKDRSHRESGVVFLSQDEETGWIYERICHHAIQANEAWGFALSGCAEPLQYTRYGVVDHYDWHMDLGPDRASIRKLSVTVQLSPPEAYEGGELQFWQAPDRRDGDLVFPAAPKDQGVGMFFPSYTVHRVSPVTRGERAALVLWVSGEPFR